MYKNSGEDINTEMRKTIEDVVNRCETCQTNKNSFLVPKISRVMPKKPNDILTLDLKFFDGTTVL